MTMTLEKANSIINYISYPEYNFIATMDGRGEMYLQGEYSEKDINSGIMCRQYTRRWFISPYMTKSELVQTALKLILTSMEHRAREHFKYRDRLVFGPHFNVDDLWDIVITPDKREI